MISPSVSSSKAAVQFCVADPVFHSCLGGMEVTLMSPAEAMAGGRIPEHPEDLQLCLWVVSGDFLKVNAAAVWAWVKEHPALDVEMIVVSDDTNVASYQPLQPAQIYIIVPERAGSDVIRQLADNAVAALQVRYDRLKTQSKLALAYQEMRRLTRVGQSLATERDFERLIELILGQARELVSADAGSIYVTERPKPGEQPTHLRFKKSAMQVNSSEFLLPIDKNSIAGYVAFNGEPLMIDDVYALTGQEEYHFNFEYDKFNNYRSRSMMVIPMKNHRNEVIGVIQLINRKRNYQHKLSFEEMQGTGVLPFSQRNLELVTALAGQAAVAIQNNMLLSDIHNLFEGFVTASVTAIEQRDPTTSGHSFRVADFTTGLAKAVDRLSDGPFSSLKFSIEQIREDSVALSLCAQMYGDRRPRKETAVLEGTGPCRLRRV
ncbi:MAG: GAF domain-containing protein [Spirochaetia bacterium]|nr:GAF domain-containing protein [Spirochaetia bacterium]